jgi:hypothetical protein
MSDDYLELKEPLEKTKTKKVLSEKQLETLAKGRAKKVENQQAMKDNKETKRLEDRFDKLVSMFESVRMPPPEVQEAIKKKRVVKPAPPPESESESESEEEAPAPKRIEKQRAVVQVQPVTKKISLSFV